jgi:hypothetical protein
MILVLPLCFLICFSVELLQTSIFLFYNVQLSVGINVRSSE